MELGFEQNDCLYVTLPNCSQSAISIYVCAKLGLIKVYGDPNNIPSELPAVLSRVECKGIVMLADEMTIEKFREASKNLPSIKHIILVGSNQVTMLDAHRYDELLKQGETKKIQQADALAERQASIDPDSPLAIVLTSGTTGIPSQVPLTNFNILNALIRHWDYLKESRARPCITQSMSHASAGIFMTLGPAVYKSTVVVPSFYFDAVKSARCIDKEKCTNILCSPIFFRYLLADPDRSKYDFSSLKSVMVGAALTQPELLHQVEKELGITALCKGYGSSEIGCVLCDSFNCKDERRFTSIGQCWDNLEVKLVDANGRIVPIGCEGELWVRSSYIMRGYYRNPEKTAETITESQWLKTGDLLKMDEDGYLYFIERIKHLIIKPNGAIVYSSEIEQALEDHESVERAHVFTVPDPRVQGIICAFVKLRSGKACEADELKKFLGSSLSDDKIPDHIHFVDDFPRTSIGKVPKCKLVDQMMKILNL